MTKPLAGILLAALAAVAAIPASLIATVLLTPLWRLVEQRVGIEAIGHSGPAGWCFLAVYATTALAALAAAWTLVRE